MNTELGAQIAWFVPLTLIGGLLVLAVDGAIRRPTWRR